MLLRSRSCSSCERGVISSSCRNCSSSGSSAASAPFNALFFSAASDQNNYQKLHAFISKHYSFVCCNFEASDKNSCKTQQQRTDAYTHMWECVCIYLRIKRRTFETRRDGFLQLLVKRLQQKDTSTIHVTCLLTFVTWKNFARPCKSSSVTSTLPPHP